MIRHDYQAAAAEFYKRQLEERIPNTYFEFPARTKDGGIVATRASIIDRYRREGLKRLAGNVTWRKKDGTEIIVRLTGRIVERDADGPDGFEAIAEDITEKRALETQLRQAQKMEAVGRLARGIAHDFNNVLAAVLGCTHVLRHMIDRDHPAAVEANEIVKAAERGASLTRQHREGGGREGDVRHRTETGYDVRGAPTDRQRLVSPER